MKSNEGRDLHPNVVHKLPEPLMIDQVALQTIRCLVRKAIRQRRFPRDEFDDLVQEIVLKLLMKMDQFDPLRSCWSTFCAMVARQHMSVRQKRDSHRIATDSIEHLPPGTSNETVDYRTPSGKTRSLGQFWTIPCDRHRHVHSL
jgi:DNA-directed RNA polymerase specialized sigma24 family protein